MERLDLFNSICATIMTALYAYQFVYFFIVLFTRNKKHKKPRPNRIGILISARNEGEVIKHLIDSINNQTYPHELITTFVCADNCTDNTAESARSSGAVVYERFNTSQVGKGYALNFLLDRIKEDYNWEAYDGFIVLDADNILDKHFVAEMNKTFSDGYRILTSYRNSKNYGDNWISAGYSLWFMREARFLNLARQRVGVSGAVSGTGFMFAREIADEAGGWPYHLLTEDIEFTCANIAKGEKVGIAIDAELFDEQPTTVKQSYLQRLRWAKGFLHVFRDYGARLAKGAAKGSFSCYDMLMVILPAIFISLLMIIVNAGVLTFAYIDGYHFHAYGKMIFDALCGMYSTMYICGLVTTIYEWDRIHTSTIKKILYTFTFPFFMATYFPIGLIALFKKVEWKPIKHTAKTMKDIIKK